MVLNQHCVFSAAQDDNEEEDLAVVQSALETPEQNDSHKAEEEGRRIFSSHID